MTGDRLTFEIEARMRRDAIKCEIELSGSTSALEQFLLKSTDELAELLKIKPE
jgi:hypothetical protein